MSFPEDKIEIGKQKKVYEVLLRGRMDNDGLERESTKGHEEFWRDRFFFLIVVTIL